MILAFGMLMKDFYSRPVSPKNSTMLRLYHQAQLHTTLETSITKCSTVYTAQNQMCHVGCSIY